MAAFIVENQNADPRPLLDLIIRLPGDLGDGVVVVPLPPVAIDAPLAAVPEPEWSAVLVCMGLLVAVAWRASKSSTTRRGKR